MRRTLSILLLLVLGMGQAAPASLLASGLMSGQGSVWTGKVDESRLPACCRRNGKHHCAMGSAADSSSDPAVSAPDSCPFMPHALASTAPTVAAIAASAADSSALPSEPRVERCVVLAAQMSDRRGWPKRGPPSLQIL